MKTLFLNVQNVQCFKDSVGDLLQNFFLFCWLKVSSHPW